MTVQTIDEVSLNQLDPLTRGEIEKLAYAIEQMGPSVAEKEAVKAAETAILYPIILAGRYELKASPIVHNMMINSGLKKRGLCIHWTEDLLERLDSLGLRTLSLYWGVAHRNELMHMEHSSAIIAPKNFGIQNGIVLDGWRNSGNLSWARVPEDSYPWKNLYRDPKRTWKKQKGN